MGLEDLKIITAVLAKNESDRYWRSYLEAISDFSDLVCFVDDLSDDDTVKIAKEFPKVENCSPPAWSARRRRDDPDFSESDRESIDKKGLEDRHWTGLTGAWGDESRYRKYLFKIAMSRADPGDVVFWLDADMVPLMNPRNLFESIDAEGFAFPLFDLWGRDQHGRLLFRDDPPFWIGHRNPRIWAIRCGDDDYDSLAWEERGIHCGHIPQSWVENKQVAALQPQFGILHYGYHTSADRADRDNRYKAIKHQLTEFEWEHAKTILSHEKRLLPLPFRPQYELERATDRVVYA